MQIKQSRQPKIQQNKTTLVQSPLMTLSQETRWIYSTMVANPHGGQMSFLSPNQQCQSTEG